MGQPPPPLVACTYVIYRMQSARHESCDLTSPWNECQNANMSATQGQMAATYVHPVNIGPAHTNSDIGRYTQTATIHSMRGTDDKHVTESPHAHRSSRSTLMDTKLLFRIFAVASFSKLSRSITWHQWHLLVRSKALGRGLHECVAHMVHISLT